jgi:hypothetical protein
VADLSHIRIRCEPCGTSRPFDVWEGIDPKDYEAHGASVTALMQWLEEHLGCGSSGDPDPEPVPAPFLGAFDGEKQP